METNEQAQEIIRMVHVLSGQLLEASKDGRIDTSELLGIGLKSLPSILNIVGIEAAGN